MPPPVPAAPPETPEPTTPTTVPPTTVAPTTAPPDDGRTDDWTRRRRSPFRLRHRSSDDDSERHDPADHDVDHDDHRGPPVANVNLVPLCTAAEDFDAGTRTFRVDNNSGQAVEITLQNVDTGGSVSGTAPPGQSTWNVPAGDGANTTELIVDGQTVATADSTNLVCAVLHGNAECDPASGTTTITWTVSNNDGSPGWSSVTRVAWTSTPIRTRPTATSIGTEVIDGPATDQQITETVTVQLADGEHLPTECHVTAAACEGPAVPPEVTFTFTKSRQHVDGIGRRHGRLRLLRAEHERHSARGRASRRRPSRRRHRVARRGDRRRRRASRCATPTSVCRSATP